MWRTDRCVASERPNEKSFLGNYQSRTYQSQNIVLKRVRVSFCMTLGVRRSNTECNTNATMQASHQIPRLALSRGPSRRRHIELCEQLRPIGDGTDHAWWMWRPPRPPPMWAPPNGWHVPGAATSKVEELTRVSCDRFPRIAGCVSPDGPDGFLFVVHEM